MSQGNQGSADISNIHGIAELLSRIAAKAFFEQYFKADEYARQILKAGEDLSDFVQIFEVCAR